MAADDKYQITNGGTRTHTEAPSLLCSSRLSLAIIGFLGFINVYALRVNLSVAIVCMVNQTAVRSGTIGTIDNVTDSTETECASFVSSQNGTTDLGGSFVWDKKVQGSILGSFFWGYLVSQVPAGWIATKYGGKWIFGFTMLIASIATIITPVLAQAHYGALIFIRVVIGIATGMTFPAMHTIWGSWAPPLERTKLMTFTYSGAQAGIVLGFPLSGFLCQYGFGGGWPSVFYVTGIVSLVWTLAWMMLVSETPTTHKRISAEERMYILSSLEDNGSGGDTETSRDIPWCKILTSLPVYAIIVGNITSDWGAFTLLTNIPTYISEVLKFDIASNGLVSALPFIAFWLFINVAGWVADTLRVKGIMSTGLVRKSFNGFGMIIPAIMLVGLGYVDCSQPVLAVALLVLAVSMTGTQYSGYLVNHVDIAPAFAGLLFGISNSLAASTGFFSAFVVGLITEEDQTRTGWQIVFWVAAAVYIFGAVFFFIFASGELQPWARSEDSDDDCKPTRFEMKVEDKGESERFLEGGDASKV